MIRYVSLFMGSLVWYTLPFDKFKTPLQCVQLVRYAQVEAYLVPVDPQTLGEESKAGRERTK